MSHQSVRSTGSERRDVETVPDGSSRGCPECGHVRVVSDRGEEYCPECGLVVSDRELERTLPRWISGDARHVGPGVSMQRLQRGTCVGLDGGLSRNVHHLRRFNQRLGSTDRTVRRGLRELRGLCEELELGRDVRERAAYLYRQVVSEGLLKGRGIEEFAAASVLVAAREVNYPLTIDWIAEAAFAEASEISDAYRTMLATLELKILPPDPHEFVPRLVSDLGLSPWIERIAVRILDRARDAGITVGKHPTGLAGAAIYAAAREESLSVTQEEIATAAGVGVVTISRQWRAINDRLDITEA